MLGQGELEAIGAAEALGAQGVDERVRIERERELLDAEVLEVIVLREHLIDREVAHIDRETGLKAHALRIEEIRLDGGIPQAGGKRARRVSCRT